MPDVTGMPVKAIALPQTYLYGAFYQTPYDDDPRIKDLRALLEMISNDDTDEVQFVQVEADNCVAFGFMNTTRLNKLAHETNHYIDLTFKNKIIKVLNDINLETEDHIYEISEDVKIYLDYTLVK